MVGLCVDPPWGALTDRLWFVVSGTDATDGIGTDVLSMFGLHNKTTSSRERDKIKQTHAKTEMKRGYFKKLRRKGHEKLKSESLKVRRNRFKQIGLQT